MATAHTTVRLSTFSHLTFISTIAKQRIEAGHGRIHIAATFSSAEMSRCGRVRKSLAVTAGFGPFPKAQVCKSCIAALPAMGEHYSLIETESVSA